jgi:predicted N-formylglutamate amidohydrolase
MAMRKRFDALILTCEHGGARIPAPYRHLFRDHGALLATHRGYDIGALPVARALAKRFAAPLVESTVSRLVVDLNRSTHHPKVFSEMTKGLSLEERRHILDEHYQPYREAVESAVRARLGRGQRVLHISVHSFTPKLDGEVRNAEIGLLYDPKRPLERSLAQDLESQLKMAGTPYRVRRNYPYKGYADGLQTYLRTIFGARSYAGMELEMNQAIVREAAGQRAMTRLFCEVFASMGLV